MRFPALPPPTLDKSLELLRIGPHIATSLADGRYLHWDELRRRPPPRGLSSEEWWAAQKMARRGGRVEIPGFVDTRARPFWYCRLDAIDRATHTLDRRDAVREMIEAVGDTSVRAQYRVGQLIEEAISSSLIEGAKLTTRAEAHAMVREGRKPVTHGERMVANNYAAMNRLLELTDQPLAVDDLREIHALLGADALDAPNAEGRLRTPSDNVRVEDAATGETWFIPPPAHELQARLQALLTFANQSLDAEPFVHPLLRAIILHFWLAYLHPFIDGNGRMARALFYWQMLRSGYDFAQYLSISGPIDRSKRAYYRSFVYTETDECDLTYFLLNQLRMLSAATTELIEHLRERSQRMLVVSKALPASDTLNHRQRAALLELVQQPQPGATVSGHASSYRVTYLTARKDLQDMVASKLLKRVRIGKTDHYRPTERVQRRFST
ncbi:MAG TPA: Fic family protein [Polyangiales bacterium]|nr:Fic family protein [Polyangiales bacterium]